jgi:hypothetical protein
MKTSSAEGLTHSESESGRELIYADEFKRLIHENPGVIASFLKFDETAKEKNDNNWLYEGEVFVENDLRLTVISRDHKPDGNTYFYYKAEIGEETFFVKSVPGHYAYPNESGGVAETNSLEAAKKALNGMSGVEVVDYKLGYEDKNGHSYFVSKWVEGAIIAKYMRLVNPEVAGALRQRVFKIIQLLENSHYDVNDCNMMYDPIRDVITIFDIHELKRI